MRQDAIDHLVKYSKFKRKSLTAMDNDELINVLCIVAKEAMSVATIKYIEYVQRFYPNAVCVQDRSDNGWLIYTSPYRENQIGSGSTERLAWKMTATGLHEAKNTVDNWLT